MERLSGPADAVTNSPRLPPASSARPSQFVGTGDAERIESVETAGGESTLAWKVAPEIHQVWQRVIASRPVVAVLAGHFHDSHRSIYETPYGWTAVGDAGLVRAKLRVAPPLALKNQDTSLAQARGFAVVSVRGRSIERVLMWLDPVDNSFAVGEEGRPAMEGRTSGI